jgi:hypothetical protein
MSIASLILALVPAVAAKSRRPPPQKPARELRLEAEVRTLTFALDYWREAANTIQAQNERLVRERDELRRRHNQLALAQYAQTHAQMQQHAAAQNTMLAQQHQAMANQQLAQNAAYHQDLQGMQQLAWGDCNCVPSRGS